MSDIFKINDIEYECEFTLSNSDKQEVKLTKSAIRGLEIIDNVFDPFASGTLSLANAYDYIEHNFLLRGDGRDEFYIKFKPKDSPDSEKYEYTFSIIDESNSVNPNVRSESIKIYQLIDKHAIPFSDTIPYGKTYSGKVGKILQDIFKDVLGEDKVDKNNWVEGDFAITYTPPATFRYIDLIHYLMRIFYGKDGELYVSGFIDWDDTINKFRMDLLSKIFSDNKKSVIEGFALGDFTDNTNFSNPNNPPPDAPVGQFIFTLKNFGYSTVCYKWTNDYFVNALVFGYDNVLGVTKIRKLKFEDIKKKWSTKFVDVFKSTGGKVKPSAIMNKTTSKKFQRYKFPYSVEDSVKIVEAEMYNALTFYNLQVAFSNIGKTSRRSGKFVDVFTTKKVDDNNPEKSNEKALGRWYITELRHIFVADLYTNEISCAKTYLGPDNNTKSDAE